MKSLFKTLLPAVLLVLTANLAVPGMTATTAVAAPASSVSVEAVVSNVGDNGNTIIDQAASSSALSPILAAPLSTAERDGLLYMREEEKLAQDVYLTLYQQWPLPIFQNIANSEATHMAAVKILLDRYGLADPAAGQTTGSFTHPDLQALYEQLVVNGSKTLGDALRVGAAIEEIDLLDLEERLAQTDKPDIRQVYENLMKGSRNHLRAFTRTLQKQTGETYEPQYLDPAEYEKIVNSPMERGRGGSGQGQGRGQQN